MIEENIHIVLVATTHPGNIGATARAMKTMGISKLDLVASSVFPSAEATARASGADDILMSASVYESLGEAISDCSKVFAASVRSRSLSWPVYNPERASAEIKELISNGEKVAIVFGRESSGLSNEELDLCHGMIRIQTNPGFSSLNLASAVQIICYELRKSLISERNTDVDLDEKSPLANVEQMNLFYQHLQECMTDIGYFDPEKPRLLMRRMKRLFNRACVDVNEYNILRGILSATRASVKKNK